MVKYDDIFNIRYRNERVQESLLNLVCSLEKIGFMRKDQNTIDLSNTIDNYSDIINELVSEYVRKEMKKV